MPTTGVPNGVYDVFDGIPPSDAFRDGAPTTVKPVLILDRLTGILYTKSAAGVVAPAGVDPNITYDATNMNVTAPAGLGLWLGANAILGSAIRIPAAGTTILTQVALVCGSGFYTARVNPTYGPVVSISVTAGNVFRVVPTDGVAFAIGNPSQFNNGQVIVITIKNTFGVLGAMTFGANYRIGAAWVAPANGFSRSIWFTTQDGLTWIEIARTAADVAN